MDDRLDAQIVALLTQSAEALVKGDTSTAIALAEELLDDEELPDPAWVAALTIRAKALLDEGLLPDALGDLDAVLQVMPDDAQALVTRGYVQANMNMLDEAEADLRAVVDADPDGEHGAAAAKLLASLRDDGEGAEPWTVGAGRPLVVYEEPWCVIALPDCWEPHDEELDPPASRWTTGDVDLDLIINSAQAAEGGTLDEVFDELVRSNTQAIEDVFETRDIVHTREELGGLPAHMITAVSTVPRLVMATLLLQGPTQVLMARLLDHRPGIEPEQCMRHLMTILDGAQLPG